MNGIRPKGLLSDQDYINHLQRFIIVHSYIYYMLDENAVSDRVYNENVQELLRWKDRYPELWTSSMYYKQFGGDYDGSTGFDLYFGLSPEQRETIERIAAYRPKS